MYNIIKKSWVYNNRSIRLTKSLKRFCGLPNEHNYVLLENALLQHKLIGSFLSFPMVKFPILHGIKYILRLVISNQTIFMVSNRYFSGRQQRNVWNYNRRRTTFHFHLPSEYLLALRHSLVYYLVGRTANSYMSHPGICWSCPSTICCF